MTPSVQQASTTPVVITAPQILDGFSYNTQLLYLPNRYGAQALAQLDTLRRAVGYRVRWAVIPDDIGEPIQPYETYYYQVQVSAGSYLYGYNFVSISAIPPGGGSTSTTAADLNINLTDSCTEVPFNLDLVNGSGMSSTFNSRYVPILLTKPRLILEPGLVNVEIANHTPNQITCQLLLCFAESCKLITEETQEQRYAQMRRMLPPGAMPRQWP